MTTVSGTLGSNSVSTSYYTVYYGDGNVKYQRVTENGVQVKTDYTYDDLGQLTQAKTGDEAAYTYTYDDGGNLLAYAFGQYLL